MDWQNLIRALVASGLTQPQIAAACGCGQSTISELMRGVTRDPRASLAFSLLRLKQERGIEAPENDPTLLQAIAVVGEVRHAA